MAITLGTKWYMPIDLGISEAYQRKTGQQVGDYNPRQWVQNTGLDYTGATERANTLAQGGSILGTQNTSGPGGAYPIAEGRPATTNNVPTAPTGDVNNPPRDNGPSLQDQISGAYSGYISALDQQLNELGGFQNQQNQYINDQAALSQQQLGSARDRNVASLDKSATEATKNKATTLRDVQQDLTNALQAGQVYLGGIGAGSSSAVGRLSGALAKAANRRTTDVSNQFQGIMSDIDLQKQNLQSVYDDQVNQLQQWKNTEINNIANWVQQQRNSLIDRRGQVDMQKNLEVINQAQQALAQLDAQSAQFNSQLQQWAADKSNSISQYVNQIQQLGQYDVPGYTYDQLSGQFQANRGPTMARFFGSGDDEQQRL